jgi:uncharacterized protein YajQ (UPF0234 family)
MNIRAIFVFTLFLGWALSACTPQQQKNTTQEQDSKKTVDEKETKPLSQAQKIVNAAIAQHGGDLYKKAKVSFDFRKIHYDYERNGGKYQYERSFKHDSLGQVHDVLTNDGFVRKVEGKKVEVTKEWANKYSNSINSVVYFMFLPFNLNDGAVIKKYMGETTIKGQPYHQIQVTFKQEGGGEDHSDVYMYWIHKDKNTMDYFAYSYEVNEGGVRFRAAYNPRKIEGITFLDYENYKAEQGIDLKKLPQLFEKEGLKLLSKIENKNIKVNLLK